MLTILLFTLLSKVFFPLYWSTVAYYFYATGKQQAVKSFDKKQSTTLDIAYFFTPKVDGEPRSCMTCVLVSLHFILNFYVLTQIFLPFRKEHDALEDKTQWPNNRNFKYSSKTATSGLRSHLERFHKEEYILLGKERGWVMQLASLKSQQGQSTTGPGSAINLPKILFSSDAVTNHLIRFIVANDQVKCIFLNQSLDFINLLGSHDEVV